MPAFKDLSGQKFGKLTAIKRVGKDRHGNILWHCLCDCGNTSTVRTNSLKSGRIKTCGCFNIGRTTHGLSRMPINYVWQAMIQRCYNINNPVYKNYGGRGIKVCYRWRNSFEAFFDDMGHPEKGMSIDRIDNDKGYSPDNCKWSTAKEQCNNTRKNRRITYNGMTRSLTDWSFHLGGGKNLVSKRVDELGWSEERAVTTKMIERYSHKVL